MYKTVDSDDLFLQLQDLHPPDSSYQSIGVTFEDVQLEIMLPANEPTTNEVNEAFRKTCENFDNF